MPRERVHVALRSGTVVVPRLAAVRRAHEPTELDPDQQEVGVVRARRDPAHVRRPGPGREAPGRPRRELEQCGELDPGLAAIVAPIERARLGAGVDGPVGRADREREDPRRRQPAVDPGAAAVGRPANTALAQPRVDDVGVGGIESEALRTAPAQRKRRPPDPVVLVEPGDRITRGRVQTRHPSTLPISRVRHHESDMKPRIFLGSSGKQAELLGAIARGLEDVADVEPWTTTFNPGRSTLDRLVELSQEVDFATFLFAQDDWTTVDASETGEASPRDNVVFEAGLFGGALGIRRTFILHASGSKLPSDLLGLTSVRYDPATSPAEVRAINKKLRKAIETEGRRGPIEGLWWQLSLTIRSEGEPSAVGLLRISLTRDGGLDVDGRAWQEDGKLSARYWSEAAKERKDPAGIFYFWKGERPRHADAPQLEGTGEIRLETTDRASGYWTTRSDRDSGLNARTSGVYLRADPADLQVLDGGSAEERAQLIAQRLREWKAAANAF